jgi:glycerol-3-phosphate dehydrogenase
MAVTVDDVLSRRTRARLLARDASADAAASVAELLGRELGWSADEHAAQVEAYLSEIEIERAALELDAPAESAALGRQPGWVPGMR